MRSFCFYLVIMLMLSGCSYKHSYLSIALKDNHIPQGFTNANDKLLLSAHNKDKSSHIYDIDLDKKIAKELFIMPLEASHTSGLCFDGVNLVATDYNSKKIYIVALEKSIVDGKAKIVRSFNSGLLGLSACDIVKHDKYGNILVVSDFRNTKKTYFLSYEKLKKTSSFEKSLLYSYTNNGFSQGVVVSKGKIYESGNSLLAFSRLDIIDFDKILSEGILDREVYYLPVFGVQDLVIIDGVYFFDEVDFNLHKVDFR